MNPRAPRAINRRALAFGAALLLLPVAAALPARAQQIDLSHGGPITVTATDGIDWHQAEQTIIARGDAKAVRDTVTVTADILIAHYRKKACTPAPGSPQAVAAPAGAPIATKASATRGDPPPGPATPGGAPAPPPPCPPDAAAGKPGAPAGATTAAAPTSTPGALNDADTGNNEIYRLEAIGHVHIYTATDQAWGDHAVYDIDQAVLVLTGEHLRLITPQDSMTARDSMEYWSQQHMAVGRGDAVVVTTDGRRIDGDVLVGYTTPSQQSGAAPATAAKPAAPAAPTKPGAADDPIGASGKLQKVDAFGHVVVRTATEIVYGDRGVYVPDTGIARLAGNVRITRGENQLNGNEAEVDLKTGVARLIATPGLRVKGLVVPNDTNPNAAPSGGPAAPAGAAPPKASVNRPIGGRP